VFDTHLAPWLCRYERKLDALLEMGAALVEGLTAAYAGPLRALRASAALALTQLAELLRWLATPDDTTPGGHPTSPLPRKAPPSASGVPAPPPVPAGLAGSSAVRRAAAKGLL
jgi:hypothetical protein